MSLRSKPHNNPIDYSSILFSAQFGILKKLAIHLPKNTQDSLLHIDAQKHYAKKILIAITHIPEKIMQDAGLSTEEIHYVRKLSTRPLPTRKKNHFSQEFKDLQIFEDYFLEIQKITAILGKSEIFNTSELGEVIKKNMTSKTSIRDTRISLKRISDYLYEQKYLEKIYGSFTHNEKEHYTIPSLVPVKQQIELTLQSLKQLLEQHEDHLSTHLSHQALLSYNHNIRTVHNILEKARIYKTHIDLLSKEILTIITQEHTQYTLSKYIDFYKAHPIASSFQQLEDIQQTLYRSYEKTCLHIQEEIPAFHKVRYLLQYISGSQSFLHDAEHIVELLQKRQEESKALLAILMEQHVDITLE